MHTIASLITCFIILIQAMCHITLTCMPMYVFMYVCMYMPVCMHAKVHLVCCALYSHLMCTVIALQALPLVRDTCLILMESAPVCAECPCASACHCVCLCARARWRLCVSLK